MSSRIYDIVARPDIVPVLRQEIRSVLKEHNGAMSTQALFSMKILDSVMRESQRMNPLGMGRQSQHLGLLSASRLACQNVSLILTLSQHAFHDTSSNQ